MSRPEFQRTEMLFGDEAIDMLSHCRVAVFGIGGVGGYVCEALARSGIGHFELFDNDKVSLSNINRQIIALHSTVGRYKTEVMRERILDINPEAEVVCHNIFYLPENAELITLEGFDYIVDAVDTVTAKLEIITRAISKSIPVISSMGTGNKTSPEMLEITDIYKTEVCPLARVMRRELRAKGIKSLDVLCSHEEPVRPLNPVNAENDSHKIPPASSAFVPSVAGLIIASHVIKKLIADKQDK